MKPIDFNQGDDLSDLFGGGPPHTLPADEQLARIRETVPEFTENCPKCRGTGRFYSYSGRNVGPCFHCKGKGKFTFKTSPEARAASREKAAAKKVKTVQENWEAFATANPERAAWMLKLIASTTAPGDFHALIKDFVTKVQQYGELTERQLLVIDRGIARDEERAERTAAARAEAEQRSAAIDASQIADAIRRGKLSGLKYVQLRFLGFLVYESRKHPGTLYVKSHQGTYLGKIVDGRFTPSRDCTPEQVAQVVLVAADPAAAARVYGFQTNTCCICGRELTNKESVEKGIGPICEGRVGFTPGALIRHAGIDF